MSPLYLYYNVLLLDHPEECNCISILILPSVNNIISFFINKVLHILPYHSRTKWHERESCHLEELLSKWNSNYRNAPNTTHYQVSKCHFPSKKYNPYKIYQKRKHAISIYDFFSKRPECQGCKFKALQTYRNSNNRNTPYATCKNPCQSAQ